MDYGFHVILSEATDAILGELPALVGAGFPSVKVFTIREFGLPDEALLRVMRAARAAGAMLNVHCENSDILDLAQADLIAAGRTDPRHYADSRPALAEVEATRRVIDYAELVDAEVYIVHMSCSGAAEALRAARRRGLRVWGETRPIYLGLTDEAYAKGGVEAAKVCGAPPLRTEPDLSALWDALRAGDIQTIGSDNTSWTVKQKAEGAADFRKIPYGVPGLETEMRVVYSEGVARGRISLQTFVSAFATTPAKLFGLYPQKRHDRGRERRRPAAAGSRRDADHRRAGSALARRVRSVPRLRDPGRAAGDPLARGSHRARRAAPEPAGSRPARASRARAGLGRPLTLPSPPRGGEG